MWQDSSQNIQLAFPSEKLLRFTDRTILRYLQSPFIFSKILHLNWAIQIHRKAQKSNLAEIQVSAIEILSCEK